MLSEIIKKYERFSDSLISDVVYRSKVGSRTVEIIISCWDASNEYKHETIKLTFNDVILFRFYETEEICSTVINTALIASEAGIILFDFFPVFYSDQDLRENEFSDFKVKCRSVSYCRVE